MIFQHDSDTISLVHLDRGAGARAVETPAFDRLPGCNFSLHRFGGEVEYLHAIVDCELQVPNVRRDHWYRNRIFGTIGWARLIHAEQPRGAPKTSRCSNRTLYKRTA